VVAAPGHALSRFFPSALHDTPRGGGRRLGRELGEFGWGHVLIVSYCTAQRHASAGHDWGGGRTVAFEMNERNVGGKKERVAETLALEMYTQTIAAFFFY
jgi:hypothetical protein